MISSPRRHPNRSLANKSLETSPRRRDQSKCCTNTLISERGEVERPALPKGEIIRVDHVSKSFTSADQNVVRAIGSISCSIGQGEFISILGPSGCGKSTLMMMIAGLLDPTEGTISFRGKNVTGPQKDC